MRVNVHSHIFNLQTVLTQEAVSVFVGRLRNLGFPDFIVEAAETFLHDQWLKPEYLVDEDLLRRFVGEIGKNPKFRNWVGSVNLPFEVKLLGSAPADLAVDTLKSALGK